MLFNSSKSSCPGKSIGAFDFILRLAEKAETGLVLEFMHRQVRNYRAGKQHFGVLLCTVKG